MQQLAFRFMHLFWVSRRSCGPLRNLVWIAFFDREKPCWTFRNLRFCSTFHSDIFASDVHDHWRATGRHTTFRCGNFLLLMVVWWGETYCASNSLELGSCFMPLGQDLTTVPVQGIIARQFRHLGTESCFWFCFSLTSSPLVPYLMLSSLPR